MNEDAGQIRETFERCAAGSTGDCDSFFRLVYPVFRRVVSRIAQQHMSTGDIDDIVQEVSLKISGDYGMLARMLPAQTSAVPAYFAVVAANGARDWFRSRGAQKRGSKVTSQLDETVQSLAVQIRMPIPPERAILIQEIENAVEGSSREKTIFRLYYQQGYSAREIATIPAIGLSTKGVESLIGRLVKQLQEKLAVREGTSLGKASSS